MYPPLQSLRQPNGIFANGHALMREQQAGSACNVASYEQNVRFAGPLTDG
jgi:hypothetical protein